MYAHERKQGRFADRREQKGAPDMNILTDYVRRMERLRDHLEAEHGIPRSVTEEQDPVDVHAEVHLEEGSEA